MSKPSLVFQRTKVKIGNLKFHKGVFFFLLVFTELEQTPSKKYEGKDGKSCSIWQFLCRIFKMEKTLMLGKTEDRGEGDDRG